MATAYDFLIRLYVLFLQLAARFHPKARLWVQGRRDWRRHYAAEFAKTGRVLWVHAASLGEFEQGRPVIEAFRQRFPDWQIVLSFYSPSGYTIRKNYDQVDFVCYLPADTRRNARDFVELIQPDAALFVKYEFWANYLFALRRRGAPTLLISALFRPGQPFFAWYGLFWRRMLQCFTHFFVQNEPSAALLRGLGFQNATVAGDTRVDRVLNLAAQAPANPVVKTFAGAEAVLVAGSTWEYDEALLLSVAGQAEFAHLKLVIAPHEPSERHLAQLLPQMKRPFLRYSACSAGQGIPEGLAEAGILVIDNIGLLNTLYRYGRVAYIGGGFGKGIHNTLEPAAFGLPILFGPKYEKFEEARQFVARGGAFVVHDRETLTHVLRQLAQPAFYRAASAAVLGYLEENRGATDRVLDFLAGVNP